MGDPMQDPISEQKARLRAEIRRQRQAMDWRNVSEQLREHLGRWELFLEAAAILSYAPMPLEPDLLSLVTQYPEKHWYLPRMLSDGTLDFHRYQAGDPLERHAWGVTEPAAQAPRLMIDTRIDLILTPALQVDPHGIRLGYGKGYYDRFLTGRGANAPAVCVIPDACFTSQALPAESWDIPVQWVVTEKRLCRLPVPRD